MPMLMRFRCNSCGHRFECMALSREEAREAKRRDQPVGAIHCPACKRIDVRKGWE